MRDRWNVRWQAVLTATSSIHHGGEQEGTTRLFRRELVASPGGVFVEVPAVTGNGQRGAMRRIGEALLAEVLGYPEDLSVAAANVLRSGGALAKVSGEPLSGSRLKDVRDLPLLGVFGGATGGTLIDGVLTVGKAWPVAVETEHLTGISTEIGLDDLLQLEPYSRVGEHQMRFELETLCAGTQFVAWCAIREGSAVQVSFFAELLDRYLVEGTVGVLGGRLGIGHGSISGSYSASAEVPPPRVWRDYVGANRARLRDALGALV